LWRTAKLLAAHPRIELPEHARELVEDAYNQEKFPTPEVFEASAQAREGKAWSEASLARANALRFEHGYGAEAADGAGMIRSERPFQIGWPIAFAYTTALNHMLARGSDQKKQLGGTAEVIRQAAYGDTSAPSRRVLMVGDATTVFWTEKPTRAAFDFGEFFDNPESDDEAMTARSCSDCAGW